MTTITIPGEPPYWIGREEPLQPQPPELEGTALAVIADELAPGEIVLLGAAIPSQFQDWVAFTRWRADNNSLTRDDQTWGAKHPWDSKRKRLYYIGDRTSGSNPDRWNIKIFSAETHAWRHGSQETEEQIGTPHTYGRQTLDEERGHLYYQARQSRIVRYLIDENAWEILTPTGGSGVSIPATGGQEYFPALDLVIATEDKDANSRVMGWSPTTGAWESLGVGGHDGHHCHIRHNKIRDEVLIMVGNDNTQKLTFIDSQGSIDTSHDPIPASVGGVSISTSMSNNCLSIDPLTGNYLWLDRDSRRLWEYEPDLDEWRLALNFSDPGAPSWPGPYYGHQLSPVYELGILFWISAYEPRVYRHATVFGD